MASSSQIEMEGMRSFFVRALRAVEYTTSEATALGKQNERELESLRSEIDRLRKAGGKENQIGGENMLALDAKVETLFSSQRALSQKIER